MIHPCSSPGCQAISASSLQAGPWHRAVPGTGTDPSWVTACLFWMPQVILAKATCPFPPPWEGWSWHIPGPSPLCEPTCPGDTLCLWCGQRQQCQHLGPGCLCPPLRGTLGFPGSLRMGKHLKNPTVTTPTAPGLCSARPHTQDRTNLLSANHTHTHGFGFLSAGLHFRTAWHSLRSLLLLKPHLQLQQEVPPPLGQHRRDSPAQGGCGKTNWDLEEQILER